MAEHSLIEWTDATWNPITGCSVVSPGCTNCYAMKLAGTRLKHHESRNGLTRDSKAGPVWTGEVRLNEQWLDQPLRWKTPRKIFVCAHGDLFAENVPDEWIVRVMATCIASWLLRGHVLQVLTKRAQRMRLLLNDATFWEEVNMQVADLVRDTYDPLTIDDYGPGNMPWGLWLGVSAEDQTRADERIPDLLATPAAVRFVSAEPLLGPIDIDRWIATAEVTCKACKRGFWLHNADPCEHEGGGSWTLACPHCSNCRCKPGWTPADARTVNMEPPADWIDRKVGRFTKVHPTIPVRSLIDWVIVGGESGPDARPVHPDWVRSLRDQCAAAGTAFFFKQWGSHKPTSDCKHGTYMIPASKKEAGRLLDGIEHSAMPQHPHPEPVEARARP